VDEPSDAEIHRGLEILLEARTVLDAAAIIENVPWLAVPVFFERTLDSAHRAGKSDLLRHLAQLYRLICLIRVFGIDAFYFLHFLVPHDEIDEVSEYCARLSASDQRKLSTTIISGHATDIESWHRTAPTLLKAWEALSHDSELIRKIGLLSNTGRSVWLSPSLSEEAISLLARQWIAVLGDEPAGQLPEYSRKHAVRIAAILVGFLAREQKFVDFSEHEIDGVIALLVEARSDRQLDATLASNLLLDCVGAHRYCIHSGFGIRASHLDRGIVLAKQAATALGGDDGFKIKALDWLSELLGLRFNEAKRISDLQDAIDAVKELLRLDQEASNRENWRLRLGSALGARFAHVGNIEDLNDAIAVLKAINADDNADPAFSIPALRLLLERYRQRSELLNSISDLNAAIATAGELAAKVILDHVEWCGVIDVTAILLDARYKLTGNLSDLKAAIQLYYDARLEEIVDAPLRLGMASNLATFLLAYYDERGDARDLESAITVLEEAQKSTRDQAEPRPAFWFTQAVALFRLYQRSGAREYLDRSLQLLEDVTTQMGNDVPAGYLQSLAHTYSNRFTARGDLQDLQAAVSIMERAVAITDPKHPHYPQFLGSLGGKLAERFDAVGSVDDLNRALQVARESVLHTDPNHRQAPGCWYNLAVLLRRLFKRTLDAVLLDEAIDLHFRAIEHSSEAQPAFADWLSGLANALRDRHELKGDPADIDEAIICAERALKLTPHTSGRYHQRWANLADAHLQRFEYRHSDGDIDLEKVIEFNERALRLVSIESADRPIILNNLGGALYGRYFLHRQAGDRERALKLLKEAGETSLSVNATLHSLQNRMWLAFRSGEWQDVIDGLQYLEPVRTRLFATNPSRELKMSWLRDLRGLGTIAASAFVELGDLKNAVVAVERTQATLLHEILDLVPEDLRQLEQQGHGEVVADFRAAGDRWRRLSGIELDTMPGQSGVAGLQELKDSRAKLDTVISQIRSLPEFSHFLRATEWHDVEAAAARVGVLVYAIAAPKKGYVLIVEDTKAIGQFQPRVVPLPALAADDYKMNAIPHDLRSAAFSPDAQPGPVLEWERTFDKFSKWFFDAAIAPLLADLGSRVTAITVVPVGELISAPWGAVWEPLHDPAAGKRYVFDKIDLRVVPTARLLTRVPNSIDRADLKMLAIIDPRNVGVTPLPFSGSEQFAVTAGVHETTVLAREHASRESVIERIGSATAAHFCCHGSANLLDPLDGYLLLAAGQRLTLRDLLAVRLDAMELITLSACETGVHGDIVPDEAVGLASGLLAAGARAVIAALWPIPDLATAMLVYRLHAEWNDGTDSARALRRAQIWLRESTNGEKYQYFFDQATAEDGHSPVAAALFVGPLAFLPSSVRDQEHPRHWASFSFYGTA
jgi:CHAT domain-containing protein/tetratricopeptide (TPR) repeat protein